jgi:hypothetical protein
MAHLMPMAGVDTATLLVRPAAQQDMAQIRDWLPQAFWGQPRPQIYVAIEQSTRAIFGAATLRILPQAGPRGTGYFLTRIDRDNDAHECAGALLNTVVEAAGNRSVGRLESGCLFEETDPCAEVLRGLGMTVLKERLRFHVDSFARALARISPLFNRVQQAGRIPQDAWIGGLEQVDKHALVAFIVEHLGGFPEFVLSKLDGSKGSYCPQISSVAMVGPRIVGLVLCQPMHGRQLLVDRRAVAKDCRGGWVNLAIMQRGLQEGLRLGCQAFDLQGDVGQHEDTFLLSESRGGWARAKLESKPRYAGITDRWEF